MPNDITLLRMLESLDVYIDAKIATKLEEERGGHNGVSYSIDESNAKKELCARFKSFLESEGSYEQR